MSNIVTTAKPGNIHQLGEINWLDAGFSKFRTMIKLDAATATPTFATWSCPGKVTMPLDKMQR
jgi:hypothetical protein